MSHDLGEPAWWVDHPPQVWFEGGVACLRIASGGRVWEFRSSPGTASEAIFGGMRALKEWQERESAPVIPLKRRASD